MRVGLTDQDEVQPLLAYGFAHGLFTVQIIAQDGHPQCPITRTVLAQPALGRGILTVLFIMPVLGRDELRLQGDDGIRARGGDDRCDDGMGIDHRAVLMLLDAAMRAVDLGRGEVLGAV